MDAEITPYAVIIALIWYLLACVSVRSAAEHRLRGGWIWFWISFFLSPLMGVLLLIAHPPAQPISEAEARGNLSILSGGDQ